jgi:glycosyltransferase involved in cell wall biosynthesis
MSLNSWLKKKINRQKDKFAKSILKRMGKDSKLLPGSFATDKQEFQLRVLQVARGCAADQDFRQMLPMKPNRAIITGKTLIVGYFGNIANNAYIFTKCLNRLGYQAELVLEDGFLDQFLMNRPFWEELEIECQEYEEALPKESDWQQPTYVKRVCYDPALQAQYANRYSAIPEVKALYQSHFEKELPDDIAFLLAQQMGHWPYLLAMNAYDIVQLSGAAISLGIFCPKPYVVFPTGSDLYISPFQETLFGLLMRCGYRRAQKLMVCESTYPAYLKRLGIEHPDTTPMLVDDEKYAPNPSPTLRQIWVDAMGGSKFILMACRQSWQWKGNDAFLKGFAQIHEQHPEWRLLLCGWGPDLEKSKALVQELGLSSKISWLPLLSKTNLQRVQATVDMVVDHAVKYAYGTSVLESMSTETPVFLRLWEGVDQFVEPPPMLRYDDLSEIPEKLSYWLSNPEALKEQGKLSRSWLQRVHGSEAMASRYTQIYADVLNTI